MAREFGKVWFSMLTDDDFTSQPRLDKLLYVALLAQPALNYAGVVPVNFKRLAKPCRDGVQLPTEAELQAALVRLERRRYAFTDDETGEVLVRSFIRNDQIYKQPNVLLSALRSLAQIESPKLCAVMLVELDRIPMPEIAGDKAGPARLRTQLAQTRHDAVEHLKLTSEGLSEPFAQPFGEGLPEPLLEGLSRPGKTEPFDKGLREAFGEPPVVVEVEVATSPSTGGYVEGSRAREADVKTERPGLSNDPPPANCSRHPNGTDAPCRACGAARDARAIWDRERQRAATEAAVAERRRAAELKRQAIDDCPLCDGDGYRDGRVCSHDPDEDERNAKGVKAAREALARAQAGRKPA